MVWPQKELVTFVTFLTFVDPCDLQGSFAILWCFNLFVWVCNHVLTHVLYEWVYAFSREDEWVNSLVQRSHLCGFSPVWISVCPLRVLDSVNAFGQTLHWCAFSLVWVSPCLFRFSARENVLSQILHLLSCCPLWVSPCFFRLPARENVLSQTLHL